MSLTLISCSSSSSNIDESLPNPNEPQSGGLINQRFNNRNYLIYLPSTYRPNVSYPLVLNFHGAGMSPMEQYLAMDMTSIAETNEFILVYPEGTSEMGNANILIWNSGPYQELTQTKTSTDDLSYIEALINELKRSYSINASKIYATGFSNGGFMAYALACYKSDVFAAIAPIAAIMTQEALSESSSNPCNPDKNLPVIHFHGTNDYIVNINFGYQARDFWKQRHQAFNEVIINLTDSQNSRQVQHFKYSNDLSETVVEFVKIHNGYHETFQSMDIDGKNSSQMIWDFFNRF